MTFRRIPLCTLPAPFRQLRHRAGKDFPRRQCCQQGVADPDADGAADLLGDDDPAEVVDAPDDTGEAGYAAVQSAVNEARKEGADLVYVMGHMGMEASCSPWTYADVIEHTSGIDVFLDGHSF